MFTLGIHVRDLRTSERLNWAAASLTDRSDRSAIPPSLHQPECPLFPKAGTQMPGISGSPVAAFGQQRTSLLLIAAQNTFSCVPDQQ